MNSLGQEPSGKPQTISPQADGDSALVAAVLGRDRKATANLSPAMLTIYIAICVLAWLRVTTR